MTEKTYALTKKDVEAINRLIQKGGKMAKIDMMPSIRWESGFEFEVGIIAESGYFPSAFGNNGTIVAAVNEAIGKP